MSTETEPPPNEHAVTPGAEDSAPGGFDGQPAHKGVRLRGKSRPLAVLEGASFIPGALEPRRLSRRRRYASSTLSVLTRQYVKVRGDLLVALGDESQLAGDRKRYAERCAEYLEIAKRELESRRPNLVVCSSLLFLADVTLVWLYPPGMLRLRCEAVQARLSRSSENVEWLSRGLDEAKRETDNRFLRTALEDALNYLHQGDQDASIAEELQVTRLRSLMLYLVGALALLLVSVPYITINLGGAVEGWPVVEFSRDWLTQLVSAAAISAIGAVGGIFSGLIAVRDSTTTLNEYRTSMLQLALKPLVGAVASLTLYLLLSWQILTGVEVTNGGTFLLAGFLAGFSERYFLRLLRAEEGRDARTEATRIAGQAVARSRPTQAGPSPTSSQRFDSASESSRTDGT